MHVISSGDESDSKNMSTDMADDVCDERQSHLNINRREARYRILDRFRQRQYEWKGVLLSTRKMGKGLHKVFKVVVNEISQSLPILGEFGS